MDAAFLSAGRAVFDRGASEVLTDAAPGSDPDPTILPSATVDMFVLGPVSLLSIGFTNFLSVVACAWLLWQFRSLGEKTSRVLPVRQLWHLAISDMIYSLCAVVYSVLEAMDFWPQCAQAAVGLCDATYFILFVGLYASVMVEASLGLGFAFDYWRCKTSLRLLDATLWLVWPVGVILAGVDLMSHMEATGTEGPGHCEVQRMIVRRGQAYIIFASFVLCLAAYFASIYRVHMFPGPVQGLIWRMACVYPMNFFLTYGLLMFYYMFPVPPGMHDRLFVAAYALEGLNGFVNAVSYAANCRYVKSKIDVRQLWSRAQPADRLFLAVEGPTVDASASASGSSSRSADEGRLAFVEFHVGFRENLESVVHVRSLATVSVEPSSETAPPPSC
eukprot:TRINITY_DN36056_c0_g1_i1.p1 TRINITY_DN36056_c0_g1~~TRINITY_DN36056_c0_g1_i1.p1  ORF type:complete len:418 (+),score=40.98 TRINITY_DN36056_c0_g1_i1:92-1255(+)